jgi:hypothetical protein
MKVKVVSHKRRSELFDHYGLTAAPALVIGEVIRIIGLCPSKESIRTSLLEVGLEL